MLHQNKPTNGEHETVTQGRSSLNGNAQTGKCGEARHCESPYLSHSPIVCRDNKGKALRRSADELGSVLEEGRLVEGLRPDVGALVAGRDELGRGDVVLVVEAAETEELLNTKCRLREVTPPLRVARSEDDAVAVGHGTWRALASKKHRKIVYLAKPPPSHDHCALGVWAQDCDWRALHWH